VNNPENSDLSYKGQSALQKIAIFLTFSRKSTHLRVNFVQNVKKVFKNQPTLVNKCQGRNIQGT
jgi:hypothetical protein